jgi:hypothetical protein
MEQKPTTAVLITFLVLLEWNCTSSDKIKCKSELNEIRTMVDTTIMDYRDYDVLMPPSIYTAGCEMDNIFVFLKIIWLAPMIFYGSIYEIKQTGMGVT